MQTIPFELKNVIVFFLSSPQDYLNFLLSAKFVGENFSLENRKSIRQNFRSPKEELICSDAYWEDLLLEKYFVLPNGNRDGECRFYYRKDIYSSFFAEIGRYDNGKKEGLWTRWLFDIPRSGGNYEKGVKVGTWKYWRWNWMFPRNSNFPKNPPGDEEKMKIIWEKWCAGDYTEIQKIGGDISSIVLETKKKDQSIPLLQGKLN
jgi:hypothetical protein